jgi:hypothetical protein
LSRHCNLPLKTETENRRLRTETDSKDNLPMSQAGSRAAQHGGWRGKRPSEAPPKSHGWQQASPQAAERGLLPGDHRRDLKIAGWLCASAGLLAVLVYLLLFRPEQTPLISAAVTNYSWPIPPNAWAAEDLQALSHLDGETLQQVDLSAAWQSKETGLRNLEEQLRLAVDRRSSLGAAVIYLSMHGVVDGEGEPCLLTADASPLQSETWLRVRTLLGRIKGLQLPSNLRVLLVLDSTRIDTHWGLGQLYNAFAERLPGVVEASGVPNLAIINSTGPGQIAWTSAELHGSVFGHFLREGLQGAADTAGDRNRIVSLHELHRYLQREVGRWVAERRLDVQQPMLLPANGPDLNVAWAMRTALSRHSPTAPSVESQPVSEEQLAALWRKRDELLAFRPVRFDPLVWRDFEQRLIWLERLATAGSAYAGLARAKAVELDQLATALLRRARAVQDQAVLPLGSVFSSGSSMLPQSLAAHNLMLIEYLGQSSPETLGRLRGALQQAVATPTSEVIGKVSTAPPIAELAEVQFLRLLSKHLPPGAWGRGELVARAVQLRTQAEAASVSTDERGQLWIRSAIEAGDLARRQAEDLLLVGTSQSLDESADRITQAGEHYQVAQQIADQVAQSLEARDRAWAELPAIAQWYARRLSTGESSQEIDRQINEELLPLIEATHVLGWWLSHDPSRLHLQIDAQQVTDQAAKVGASLDSLRRRIVDPQRIRELAESTSPDPRTLREIEAVLSTPLAPAPQRAELLRARTALSALIDRAPDAATDTRGSAAENPVATELHRMSLVWKRHPALAILSRWKLDPASAAGPWPLESERIGGGQVIEVLAGLGEQVRDRLASMPQEVDSMFQGPQGVESPAAANPLRLATGDPAYQRPWRPGQIRAGACRAERMVRAAAGFGFPPATVEIAARLRALDLQQTMLWQAARTLDDFYAAAIDGQPDFFVSAAEDYLKSAQAIDPPVWAARHEQQRVQSLLEQRRQAARRALRPFAADLVLIDEGADVPADVSLQTNDTTADLPEGQAAVFVSDGESRIGDSAQTFVVPPAGDRSSTEPVVVPCLLPSAELAARGPELEAVALFRGHRFAHRFLARPPSGIEVVYERPRRDTASVTLHGSQRKPGSVVFILDCSSSMSEPTLVEDQRLPRPSSRAPGEIRRGTEVPRLQVAKDALRGMLNRLAEDGGYRVGVRFFGHRVKRNLNNPREILEEPGYGRPIPPGLLPSEDVELVLPLGRFGPGPLSDVAALLDTVRPCGETPLYLAILEAQRDLAGEDPSGPRSIVVITDGANNQYNSPNPRSAADVLNAAAGRDTQVHIVGFQLSAEDEARAEREFDAIAQQTGGKYFPAANATALTQYLEGLLGNATWRVTDLQGRTVAERNIGYSIHVPTADSLPRKYVVEAGERERLVRSEIELAGGEALELHLTADNRRIECRRFDRESPVFQSLALSESGGPAGLLLGAHRPSWEGSLLRFPLSIQSDSGRFIPKPAEVWAEVTPMVTGNGQPFPYLFLDPSWTPDRPVPVLGCLASHWPAAARQAEVRFWCRSRPADPDAVMVVAAALDRQRRGLSALPEDSLPGATFQVKVKPGGSAGEPLRIAVLERHTDGPLGLAAARTDVLPAADRIERLYDPVNQLALHTFYYFQADEESARSFEVHVTTRKSWAASSMLLAEPLVVNVPEPSDVIRLTPASSDNGPVLPSSP